MNILVVVDMQNDFIDGSLGTEEAQRIVPEVVKKIQTFDGTVFATRDTHEENYLETAEGKKLPVRHCIRGTEGWGRSDRRSRDLLTEAPVDKVTFGSRELVKKLERIQEETSIESITPIGLCTDICAISNAMLCKAFLPEVPCTGGCVLLCRSDGGESHAGAGGNEDVSDRHFIEDTGMKKKRVQKMDRKDILLNKQRIVIKVGTSTDHL